MIGAEIAKRRLGQTLDERYELQRLLGVGMTGAVYEARHRYTEQQVAVKVMHQQLVADDNAVARFLREAKSVTKIGHPAIVDVLDAGRTQDGWPYVVLELLHGRSLGKALRDGPLPFELVVAIGLDLLGGLAAAHAEGIVHRDIKPDNVFLLEPAEGASPDATQGPARVKILDFGVAKNLHSTGASGVLTKPGSTVGTPSYMSPEQARAQPVDPRTDLWGVGALLFHAAAGRPPFVEPSLPALLFKIATTAPPPLAELCPDAPAPLQRAVDGALLADLSVRWQSAEQMAEALGGG